MRTRVMSSVARAGINSSQELVTSYTQRVRVRVRSTYEELASSRDDQHGAGYGETILSNSDQR